MLEGLGDKKRLAEVKISNLIFWLVLYVYKCIGLQL